MDPVKRRSRHERFSCRALSPGICRTFPSLRAQSKGVPMRAGPHPEPRAPGPPTGRHTASARGPPPPLVINRRVNSAAQKTPPHSPNPFTRTPRNHLQTRINTGDRQHNCSAGSNWEAWNISVEDRVSKNGGQRPRQPGRQVPKKNPGQGRGFLQCGKRGYLHRCDKVGDDDGSVFLEELCHACSHSCVH